MPEISQQERKQIRLVRVICIFFMMSVHVNPGLAQPSLVSTGDLYLLGQIWAGTLSRASVAALSFVSGYLLVRTARPESIGSLAARKFATLIVPMVAWNAIFLALLEVKIAVGFPDDAPADVLRALTGIGGPPVNLSLWFLRDLFVSVIAVRIALPALARWPELLVLLAFIAVTDCIEPVIFRPAILLFAAMGAFCATRSTLSGWLTAQRAIWIVAVLAGLYFMAQSFPPDQQAEAENLIRRALLTVAVLMLTRQLGATRLARYLVQWERRIFETYLLHCALFGVLWVGWTLWVGEATEPSYLAFFLLAPVAAMLAGRIFGVLCDRLPCRLQIILRGKAARGAAVTTPAE